MEILLRDNLDKSKAAFTQSVIRAVNSLWPSLLRWVAYLVLSTRPKCVYKLATMAACGRSFHANVYSLIATWSGVCIYLI